MEIVICYIIIYLAEAFIINQYCSTLFLSGRSKLAEWTIALFLYGILFGISFIEDALLNTVAFFIFNYIFIFVLYDVKWISAIFHAMIATLAMCLSELTVVGIISNLAANYYESDTYLERLIILLVSSKPLYFLVLYFISHILAKAKKRPERSSSKELSALAIIPFISFWIALTFFSICCYTELPVNISRMIAVSAILLLASNLVIYGIYVYSEKRKQEFTKLQLQLQKEYDSVSYYKMLLAQNDAQNILIHDIKKHLNSIALLNEQGKPEKIASYIDELVRSPDLQTASRVCDNEFLNAILSR